MATSATWKITGECRNILKEKINVMRHTSKILSEALVENYGGVSAAVNDQTPVPPSTIIRKIKSKTAIESRLDKNNFVDGIEFC